MDRGRLVVHTLTPEGDGLRCSGCGALHPVVDGVPVVLRDLGRWLESEAVTLLARRDLSEAVMAELRAHGPEPLRRDAHLAGVYGRPEDSPLRDAVREALAHCDGPVLDMGSGCTPWGVDGVVGLDLNFELARRYPGQAVVADAADPPFLAGAFRAVMLVNLLDSCLDPRVVLAQADALLAPGGRLVISTAYAWQDGVTPPAARFTPEALLDALEGRSALVGYPLRYALLDVRDPVTWRLRLSPRTVHEHDCQFVVALKRP